MSLNLTYKKRFQYLRRKHGILPNCDLWNSSCCRFSEILKNKSACLSQTENFERAYNYNG